ncbi:hypothetical protein WOLCODRAFT_63075, partial [Wolfiporia cocos MD-104 SS10]
SRRRSRPLIPHSSYYFGPPPPDAAYGSSPVGQIGKHHPREIVRIERDYSGGELPQFASSYPLEFEGRLTPTQFLETINSINELLISAYDLNHSLVDNALAFFTLQLSRLIAASHYDKEMRRLQQLIEDTNVRLFNPAGLHIRWPRKVAFMFLEIEYYVRVSVPAFMSFSDAPLVTLCLYPRLDLMFLSSFIAHTLDFRHITLHVQHTFIAGISAQHHSS